MHAIMEDFLIREKIALLSSVTIGFIWLFGLVIWLFGYLVILVNLREDLHLKGIMYYCHKTRLVGI